MQTSVLMINLYMAKEKMYVIGCTKEWNEAVALSWELLDFPEHEGMRQFVKKLNEIYNTYDAMYYNDCDPMGFEWMSCDDNENSVVSFVRRGSKAKDQLLFIYNFTPIEHKEYKIGVPCPGRYTQILNSDDKVYGGLGRAVKEVLTAKKEEYSGRDYTLNIELPPLSVRVFKYDYVENVKPKAKPKSGAKASKSRAKRK